MKNLILCGAIAILTIASVNVNAQESTVLDGTYIKEHSQARKVIPYAHLREGDVMFLRRIWRQIDLRQKMNHSLYFPTTKINDRKSLWDAIVDAIVNEGTITAYKLGPLLDDEFTMPMTPEEVTGIVNTLDTVYSEDLETGEMIAQVATTTIRSEAIKWYDIKEEWFFDRQRSVMDVRIIGISPNVEKIDDNGDSRGAQPLFWIYYPEARYVFANTEVYNRHNDSERRTFEDIFWKRQFNSFITKRSNVYDRVIQEYKLNLSALLEAVAIKKELRLLEHDVWHF